MTALGLIGGWMTIAILIGFVGVVVLIVVNTTGGDSDRQFVLDSEGGDEVFPSESLSDWVSYAQQMAIVTLVDEARIEPPARVYETNEGYVGRTVTIRIDRTVWHADGSEPFAAGTELTYTGWGWLYKNGEYRPFVQQLRMGERYLMPIVEGRNGVYHPLSSGTRLPLVGDRVDPDLVSNNPAVKLIRGKTVDLVGQMLAETSADPLALEYWHLDPVERYQAVMAERNAPEDIEEPILDHSATPQHR